MTEITSSHETSTRPIPVGAQVLDAEELNSIATKISDASAIVAWLNELVDEINSDVMFLNDAQRDTLELDGLQRAIDGITQLY